MIYKPRHKKTGKIKYVILIPGSGEQTRYSPYYISFGYLLAKNGFGVLLYDKRGTGSSGGSWLTASLNDLADDAVAGLNYLESRKDLNISEIGFLGTSQGAGSRL